MKLHETHSILICTTPNRENYITSKYLTQEHMENHQAVYVLSEVSDVCILVVYKSFTSSVDTIMATGVTLQFYSVFPVEAICTLAAHSHDTQQKGKNQPIITVTSKALISFFVV